MKRYIHTMHTYKSYIYKQNKDTLKRESSPFNWRNGSAMKAFPKKKETGEMGNVLLPQLNNHLKRPPLSNIFRLQ